MEHMVIRWAQYHFGMKPTHIERAHSASGTQAVHVKRLHATLLPAEAQAGPRIRAYAVPSSAAGAGGALSRAGLACLRPCTQGRVCEPTRGGEQRRGA